LFIFGKYVGVMIATLVGFYMVAVIFILAARHGTIETVSDPYDQPVWVFGLSALGLSLLVAGFGNFFYGWNFFTSLTFWAVPLLTIALAIVLCVSPDWELQHPFMATDPDRAERLHLLLQLLYAIIMMFGAALILTAFAVALSTRFSQIVTLMLCAGIMMLGLLSDYYFGTRQDGGLIFQMLYGLVPNFQVFWVGDAITQEQEIPWAIVTETAGYACCYSLAILALGVALFQTREVG
ncbi:MAG: hypothetical protein JXO22_04015, partial [Phycisphaerae bacterium]|nr:hypothetical protein [Phycisphaerae bacterium]